MKQFFEVLKQLFSAFFSSSDSPSKPTTTTPNPKPTTPPTNTNPTTEEEEEAFADGTDLPKDTVVITEVLPFDIEPGVVIDADTAGDTTTDTTTPTEDTEPTTTTTSRFMWCLDNGHAQLTPGKRSVPFDFNGISAQFFEYEFNRDIVERIMNALTERGIQFFNVVPELEEDIKLSERVRRANTLPTNLDKIYVSVHANAGPTPPNKNWTTANGIETWYFHSSSNGKKIASIFQQYLIEATNWRNRGLKSTREKNLYVLRHTSMPAILTENGFFNNEQEVKKLMDDDVRQAIADAHVAAILHIEKNGLA